MKRFSSTVIMLLLAAGLGGYIYFFERGPIAETGSAVLLRVDPNAINSITLQQPAGVQLALARHGTDWTVSETSKGKTGPAVPADPDTVKSLLDQVQLVQSDTVTADQPAKAKEFGLDKSTSGLIVNGTRIDLGDKPKFDASRIYARVGNKLALLKSALSDAATKKYADWRDKSVLHAVVDDVTEVDVKSPAVSASLVREQKSSDSTPATWKITQPLATNADASNISSFLTQVTTAKSTAFLDDQPASLAKWGLDKPQATVKLTSASGSPSLLIGKKLKGGYAAQNSLSPVVFQLPDTTFGLVNRPLKEWRSKDVLKVELGDLQQVDITSHGQTKTYTKSGDKWTAATATGAGPTDADAVNQSVVDVLMAVQGLNAQDFIDKPGSPIAYGLQPAAMQLKITSSGWPGPKILQLGSQGKKHYASVSDQLGTIFVLSESATGGLDSAVMKLFAPPKPPAPAGMPPGMQLPRAKK